MEHTKEKGDRSTLVVMLVLKACGFTLSQPFGENTRYDLLVDDGTRLIRLQCKTGQLRNGAVLFNSCSCHGHQRDPAQVRRSYRGEIDCFGVYCPETRGVYLIPVDICGIHTTLRVDGPRNNQRAGVRFARDYLAGEVNIMLHEKARTLLAA